MSQNILFFILVTLSFTIKPNHAVSYLSEKSHKAYYRYYLINRLRRPIQLLLNNETLINKASINQLKIDKFTCSRIQTCILEIQKAISLYPLKKLWEEFCSFRTISDPIYQREFIELVIVLYRCITLTKLIHNQNETDLFQINKSYRSLLLERTQTNESNLTITTIDDIAYNFYLIKRLQRSFKLLEKIIKKRDKPFVIDIKRIKYDDSLFIDNKITLHNKCIKKYVEKMQNEQKLDPLLEVQNDVSGFCFVQDKKYAQEMLMLLFCVYKSLLLENLEEEPKEIILVEVSALMDTYERIEEMSVEELLQAIDEATEKLDALKKDLETSSRKSLLNQWLIIPAGLACLSLYCWYTLW